MVFKNLCVLVLWTKGASALKGLRLARSPGQSLGRITTDSDCQGLERRSQIEDILKNHLLLAFITDLELIVRPESNSESKSSMLR